MKILRAETPGLDERFWQAQALAESLPVRRGRAVDLKLHLGRLAEGCRALGWAGPDLAALGRACASAIKRARLKDGNLRLRYWGGWNGEEPAFLAQASVMKPLPAAWKNGLRLMSSAVRHYGAASLQGRLKLNAMLPNWLAGAEVQAWADDGLRLTPEGLVAEGVWSNILAVKGGVVRTPPLALGILEGVTRARLLARLAKSHQVKEEPLTRYDLWTADEVWVCSSLRGPLKVTQVDGRVIGRRP